jgi:membrane fusion protein (multidrug efflux system)
METAWRQESGSPGLLSRWAAALVLSTISLSCSKSDSHSPGGGGNPLAVEALVLVPSAVENKIVTTGTLLANEEVELRPEISGRVVNVYFEEGSRVHQGDVLLKINDRELSAELKRKQFEEKLAADDERRKRALIDINGISQEEYDRVLNTFNMVQAEREVIESQLAQTQIVAPMTGVVGLRYVSVGSYVTPEQRVATMQKIDTMKVEFSVPEKYVGQIKTGTEVEITVGDPPEQESGTIYAVESKVDLTTRTLKARARLPNPGLKFIPGSFARVDITLQRIPDAIVIPAAAILPQLEGERVFVCENGLARSVPVTTGIRTDRSVQITSGLKARDTLILTGLLQVANGTPVRITNTLVP